MSYKLETKSGSEGSVTVRRKAVKCHQCNRFFADTLNDDQRLLSL